MKVLILNRRCIKHPEKGGAEKFTMEIAKELAARGYQVEWFSSKPSHVSSEEILDGVKFIRKGNELTTHIYGFFYAFKKQNYIIIDEFNGIGYFTFFFKNSFLFIHQLYEEFWNVELGAFGYIPRLLEKMLLRFYKNKPTITVSGSTSKDLKRLGFKKVHIVHNGLDTRFISRNSKKDKNLHLLYLGRLKKTKNPEDALRVFLRIKKEINNAKISVIGNGPLRKSLVKKYGNINGINFLGYVDEKEKYEILSAAHLILVPSIREGWGQVVIQANAVGTPALGYKVAGLKDSIINGKTGFLVENHEEMAQKVIYLWRNKKVYQDLSRYAIEWAKQFSWKKTGTEFVNVIEQVL